MENKKMSRLHTLFCIFTAILMLLGASLGCVAGITVTGTRFVSVKTNSNFRIEAILVVPSASYELVIEAMPGETLSRYRTQASQSEPVPNAIYDGKAWHIANAELDYGYILQKSNGLPEYYWVTNYNSLPLPNGELIVTESPENPCERIILKATEPFSTWRFNAPDGTVALIERNLLVRYNDFVFDEEKFSFKLVERTEPIPIKDGSLYLLASLADTQYTVIGDQYTQLLSENVSPLQSALYQTKRLEVHTQVTTERRPNKPVQNEEENRGSDDNILSGEQSAPLKVLLHAEANEPAASRYFWKILPAATANNDVAPSFVFSGKQTEYTFETAGTYTIIVQVSARNSDCQITSEELHLAISASSLQVPNVFSPNASPGINDVFRVAHHSIVAFKGVIFNEWGNKLFEWNDPNEGWDGKFHGKYVSTGVYYYVIQAKGADGKQYFLKGSISVLGSDNQGEQNNTVTQ